MNKADLLELAERVKGGESNTLIHTELWGILGEPGYLKVGGTPLSFTTSMDDALYLLGMALPGWEWGIDWLDDKLAYVRKDRILVEACAQLPAAALTAAILLAKAEKCELIGEPGNEHE